MAEASPSHLREIEVHLLESADIKRQTATKCAASIAQAGVIIAGAFLSGGT